VGGEVAKDGGTSLEGKRKELSPSGGKKKGKGNRSSKKRKKSLSSSSLKKRGGGFPSRDGPARRRSLMPWEGEKKKGGEKQSPLLNEAGRLEGSFLGGKKATFVILTRLSQSEISSFRGKRRGRVHRLRKDGLGG